MKKARRAFFVIFRAGGQLKKHWFYGIIFFCAGVCHERENEFKEKDTFDAFYSI